jgi:putative FmdB family regulatory protein
LVIGWLYNAASLRFGRMNMPIYEYQCKACGRQFEYLVLPSSPKPECPACHKKNLQQLISLCAVSSESTRQAHLKSARKQSQKIHKEKQYEEHKQAHHDD